MDPRYLANMIQSFAGQEKDIIITTEKLAQSIILGFQPLGIASTPKDGYDLVAIVDYFMPAICLAKVRMTEKGLEFFDFEWIRSVRHGIQSVRLFPDIVRGGDINRAQTVNFGPNGTLWVSRNGDPERNFFVLSPPENPEDQWSLTDKILLPPNSNMTMIHSATLSLNQKALYVIESSADLSQWRIGAYMLNEKNLKFSSSEEVPPFTYGFILANSIFTISDYRCKENHGIYRYEKLVVPDIFGNGITVLSDGSALVSVYGQACPGPFNGQPGMLLYISKERLKG